MRLLVASSNPNKLVELRGLLEPLGVEVVTPADVGGLAEVEEDRDTFLGNAEKKAVAGAREAGCWCLADDSGLEVDALDGAPGVRSARFAGEPADDRRNNERLLELLGDLPAEERGARFVCALVLARPDGEPAASFEGSARGRILAAGRGEAGFGYDPLFLFDEEGEPGCGRTFAELSREEKSRVSHRARALTRLAARLPELLANE
jgi:XTP/dITP diphosphohydrolase